MQRLFFRNPKALTARNVACSALWSLNHPLNVAYQRANGKTIEGVFHPANGFSLRQLIEFAEELPPEIFATYAAEAATPMADRTILPQTTETPMRKTRVSEILSPETLAAFNAIADTLPAAKRVSVWQLAPNNEVDASKAGWFILTSPDGESEMPISEGETGEWPTRAQAVAHAFAMGWTVVPLNLGQAE
jgi:hypothetical protein